MNGKVGPDTVPTLYPTQLYMPPPPSAADPAAIERAAQALKTAQRPVIISGNGVRIAHAYKELRALSEALGIPVATIGGYMTYRKSALEKAGFKEFPTDFPGFLAMCKALQATVCAMVFWPMLPAIRASLLR